MNQRFFVGCRLPGLNEMLKMARSHSHKWQQYDSMKTMYESMIRVDIKKAKLHPMTGKVFLSLHWVEPNARRDYGNIRAGEKFISDALVSAGILQTDARRQIVGMLDTFSVDKTNPGVWVSLEEAV